MSGGCPPPGLSAGGSGWTTSHTVGPPPAARAAHDPPTVQDFFLVLGLLCCVVGNVGFAWFLADQDEDVDSRLVTLYYVLALLSGFALLKQLNRYR